MDRVTFRVAMGRRIRAEREALGLSLTEFAEAAEVTKGQLSMVENGLRGVTIWTAVNIARELHMTLDDLVKGLR